MAVMEVISSLILGIYNSIISIFPESFSAGINVLIVGIGIVILSVFIWYFYRTLSKKNLIELNLSQYNTSDHPATNKFLAVVFYMIEYLIVMPFLIFLWFAGLTIFIFVVSEGGQASQVLFLTASTVVAIRILSYLNEDISVELAKLFPFIALAVFLLTPNSFNLAAMISRIGDLPVLLNTVLYFLIVILIIEVVMRVFHTLRQMIQGDDED